MYLRIIPSIDCFSILHITVIQLIQLTELFAVRAYLFYTHIPLFYEAWTTTHTFFCGAILHTKGVVPARHAGARNIFSCRIVMPWQSPK
jgi:hypothetical protein